MCSPANWLMLLGTRPFVVPFEGPKVLPGRWLRRHSTATAAWTCFGMHPLHILFISSFSSPSSLNPPFLKRTRTFLPPSSSSHHPPFISFPHLTFHPFFYLLISFIIFISFPFLSLNLFFPCLAPAEAPEVLGTVTGGTWGAEMLKGAEIMATEQGPPVSRWLRDGLTLQ